MKCPIINPEALAWYDASDDDDGTRLLSVFQIGTCMFHLHALELCWKDSVQQGVTEDIEAEFNDIYKGSGSGDAWDTITIKGRTYGLYAYPYNNGTHHP